ncbi:MAG TPA: small, acid-soluble spore protein, alpha/beta type [Candidatus Udaeobacter sp.]|nr:small, acid-soluble spore protein, alpha/beta type [Candidatus Udaeobacter sp.]
MYGEVQIEAYYLCNSDSRIYLVIVKMDLEVMGMGRRRRGVMSEELKYELAKDLGFYDTVQQEGWGSIRAKDAGNMIKRAIQLAEQAAAKTNQP